MSRRNPWRLAKMDVTQSPTELGFQVRFLFAKTTPQRGRRERYVTTSIPEGSTPDDLCDCLEELTIQLRENMR